MNKVINARFLTRDRMRRLLFLLGILVVIAIAGYVFLSGEGLVKTDNAYLKSNRVSISSEVSGRLLRLYVAENEPIQAGSPLFELDSRPYQITVARFEAELQDCRNDIQSVQARYRESDAKLRQAKEDLAFSGRELRRIERLARDKLTSESQLDEASHVRKQAEQSVAVIREEIAALLAELGGDSKTPATEHPRCVAAQAAINSARLDLEHTRVYSPANGLVTQLERFRPGDYVRAGSPLFALVETDQMWIEANLKETELDGVRPGQPVSIEIDAYPQKTLTGRVESVGAATGSEFSVLPAQNATGNWIKITQRIPVRITIDGYNNEIPLRLGMSAKVTIDTRSASHRDS